MAHPSRLAYVLSSVLLFGCSEDVDRSSGVDGTKRVVELSASELDTVCVYIADISGPERSFTCDGATVKSGITKERCISNAPTLSQHPNCALTVAELEACYEYTARYADNPCDIPPSDACDPLAAPACN